MKLLISFLSTLSLGSAVNHQHPLRLSDAQLEKIQGRMLQNNDDTCYSNMDAMMSKQEMSDDKTSEIFDDNMICTDGADENPSCTFNDNNATAIDLLTDICVNDLDGNLKTVNLTDVCMTIYNVPPPENSDGVFYENNDGSFYDQWDLIHPQCVSKTCTDEEAVEWFSQLISDQELIDECLFDISIVVQASDTDTDFVQDKSKKKTKNAKTMKGSKAQKSSPKSKKTKNAKNMKGRKKSKSN